MEIVTSDNETRRNIAANLQRILAERKISCTALANRTGDPLTTINRAFRGENLVKGGVIKRICEALDISADRLMSDPPIPPLETENPLGKENFATAH